MADKEKRLKVTVDGSQAQYQLDRVSQAFFRLTAAMAAASNQLSRFQSKLNSSMGQMSRSIGGLIVGVGRQLPSALSAATRGITGFGRAGFAALSGISASFGFIVGQVGTFNSVFRQTIRTVLLVGAAFAGYSAAIADAGIKTDRFINTLVVLTGSTNTAREELNALFNLADRLGASFTAAATPFTKFAAAAAGALSRSEIRDVFESFTEVSVALQLSQTEVAGVFLALQQIASKGIVSMEELRLQLAERVPGAMRLAAASMDMSLAQFEKAVQNRTVNAAEFLKRFSALLSYVFGQSAELASQRLFANVNRLTNAFFQFRQEVFASGFEQGLTRLLGAANDLLRRSPDVARALGEFSERIFTSFANTLNNLQPESIINIFNKIIAALEALVNAFNEVAFRIRRLFDEDFDSATKQVEERIKNINRLVKERQRILQVIQAGYEEVEIFGFGFGSFRGRRAEVRIDDERLQELHNRLRQIEGQMAETIMSGLQEDIDKLGLTIGVELDPRSLDKLNERLKLSVADVTFERINPPTRGTSGINTSNIPTTESPLTGNARAVLTLTDQMLKNEIPDFFSSAETEKMLTQMDELSRISHNLEISLESRDLLLQKILEKSEKLRDLRNQELDDEGNNLAEQTRLQTELGELMSRHAELVKEINDLNREQNDIIQQRHRDYISWLSDQRLVRLSQNLGFSFASAFEDGITAAENFRDVIRNLGDDIIRLTTRILVTQPLSQFLTSFISGLLPTPGGKLPTHIVDPMPPTGNILNAHTGASFVVPGAGGVDSKRVIMNVTPGERITVEPLSKQRRAEILAIKPPETKVEIHNYSGASVEEQTEVDADENRLIKIIIGSVASDIARNGEISQLLRAKYGLSPSLSRR